MLRQVLRHILLLSTIVLSGFSMAQVVMVQTHNNATIGLDRKAWAGVGNTGNHSDGYAHDFTLPQSTNACQQITGITVAINFTGHNTNNICPSNTVYFNLYYGCTQYTGGATCLPGTSLIAEPNLPPTVNPPTFNFGNPLGGPVNPGIVPNFGGNLSVDIIPVSNPGCNAVANGHISYQYTITVTVTIAQLGGPAPPVACYETAVLNPATCLWSVTGTQPTEPPAVNCWDNFVFNTATCAWENIGTQPNIPTINLGPDQSICAGQTVTLTAPTGFNSYLWSNGATTQTITVNQSGTYSVTGTLLVTSPTNLINNPGFNQGNTGFTTSYTVGTGGTWGLVSNGNTYSIVTSPNLAHNHLANCPYQGNMLVANGGNSGNNANVWCQTIAVAPNTNYVFSVDAINPHNNAGWGVLPLTLNLVINGNVVGSLTPPLSPNNCAWQTYSSSVWNSGNSTSVTLCIQNATTSANLLAIDNLNFSPVITCTQTDAVNITVVNAITPTFNAAGPYCLGATIPALPTTSNNGITGTWSPAINNTATTTYTFTPNANQCAANQTMTVVVSASVTPTFNQVAAICSGQALSALPTTSTNGITGTWSPAVNNTATTTYTFTPSASLCATTQNMTIVVNPNITPTFTQVAPICQGQPLAALPNNSNNGITGTWSPAINNSQTTTYTFTPSGSCSPNQSMTIVVNQSLIPTFNQVPPICIGQQISALPTTSNNGITGTWSPALNNTATTTYTFTPNANQCATNQTMTVVVSASVTPTFNQVAAICSGQALSALPTTSTNGITGTWSPAVNNTATTTYTFTPSASLCATTQNMTIVVNPNITPTFTQVAPICQGQPLAALPNNSNNGITGTWSPAINNLQTTTYTFTPSGSCSPNQTMTIVVNPSLIPTFNQVPPTCLGEQIAALPTTSNNGITGTWSPALNNTATTTYTFTPNAGQCAAAQTMAIVVNQSTIPTFTPVNPICIGGDLAELPNTSNNGFTGIWSPALNNQETTTYTFTPNIGQCAESAELVITITPQPAAPNILCYQTATWNPSSCQWDISGTPLPAVNAGPDQNICVGSPMTLSASGSGSYQWNNGVIDGVPFVQNVPSQTYTVIGVDAYGCTSQDQITVTLVSAPTPLFGTSASVSCEIPFDVVISNSTQGNIVNCSWNFGNGLLGSNCDGATITYSEIGCYDISLTVTDANGCTNTSTTNNAICLLEQPTASFFAEPAIQDVNFPINFFNTSVGASSYNWDFGNNTSIIFQENPNYTYSEADFYTVTLVALNELGCSDTAKIDVQINEPLLFYVPNSFTPDGKNYNEEFLPVMTSGFDPWDYELTLFNRWGEIVFVSQNSKIGWNGKYNNETCPEGVYVWQIRVRKIDGVQEFHRGHVNLLR